MVDKLVQFETAISLYNKGFNLPHKGRHEFMYDTDGALTREKLGYQRESPEPFDKGFILCPTLYLAQRWLREIHELHVSMQFKPNIKKWDYIVYPLSLSGYEYVKYYREYYKHEDRKGRSFDTYEEALEAGLLEGLNLIPDNNE